MTLLDVAAWVLFIRLTPLMGNPMLDTDIQFYETKRECEGVRSALLPHVGYDDIVAVSVCQWVDIRRRRET